MKRILLSACVLCLSICAANTQCGDIILTNQGQVNDFNCGTTVAGNLTIWDNGEVPITNLNPIFFSGLTTVEGTLTILLCPDLVNLEGLDEITSVGGLTILGNGITEISDAFPFKLQSAGEIIIAANYNLETMIAQFPDLNSATSIKIGLNPVLEGVAEFYNIGSLDTILVNDNPSLTIVGGFSSLGVCPYIGFNENALLETIPTFNTLNTVSTFELTNSAVENLNDIGNITSINEINIADNSQLQSINAFSSLQSLNGNTTPPFSIIGNTNLTDVTGFQNVTFINNPAASPNSIELINNSSLSDCCWLLPLIDAASGGANISGNATGCENISAIGGQSPNLTCPAGFTVSVDPGSCVAAVSFTNPLVTDDCDDIVSYTQTVSLPGLTITDSGVLPGETAVWDLPVGQTTFMFTTEDGNGFIGICTTSVTVVDEVPPTWLGGGNSMTITGVCGVNDLNTLYNNNIPSAVDNCSGVNVIETTTLSSICGGSTSNEYVFNATDDSGNSATPYTLTIIIEDTTQPQFSNVPADMTISCDDNFPSIPVPTAVDVCAGDITSDILSTSSVQFGDCTFNDIAELHSYIWSVDDGCGNIATANWNLTVINDFSFDLGDDVVDCDSGVYTINPGNIGSSYQWSTGATSQSINVTSSGTYVLTVTSNNGCCAIDEIDVVIGNAPDISATGNTLDCSGMPVSIFGNSNTAGVTYSWTGPGGFTSNNQNPSVTEQGTYTLTVTSGDLCTSTTTVEVEADVNVPDVTAAGGTIDCESSSVILMGSSSVTGVAYNWTGPGGFNSNQQNPEVTLDGVYTLEVTAPNDCSASQSAVVDLDDAIPTISITEGTVNCDNQTVFLLANSNTNGLTYDWSGPNGFNTDAMDAEVSETGTYTLNVISSNGCANSTDIFIAVEFEYETTINTTPASGSEGGTAEIIIDGGVAPFTVSWDNGTTGFVTTNLSVGVHTVTIEDGYGCVTMEDFEITTSTSVNNEELDKQVNVYPNPSTGKVFFEVNNKRTIDEIIMYDLTGGIVYKSNAISDDVIDISNLSDGMYLLQLRFENDFLTKKIIKQE